MSETEPPHGRRGERAGTLLFSVSTAAIALQILEVRVFSYSMNHAFVYLAISLAMLGFGLAGTLLSLAGDVARRAPRSAAGVCALLFGVTTVGAGAIFARHSAEIVPAQGLSLFSSATAILLVFAVPQLFAGLAVALALLARSDGIGRRYSVNLLGSAAGAVLVSPLIGTVGAERLMAGLALVAAAGGLGVLGGRLRSFAWVIVVALGGAVGWAPAILPFQPDSFDQLTDASRQMPALVGAGARPERVFGRWDPVGRIELHRMPGPFGFFADRVPVLFYTQDAGAGSVLISLEGDEELTHAFSRGTLYGLATRLRPAGEVLVIGVGGGPDVLASLNAGARHVTAVEINGATVDLLDGEYRDFVGFPPAAEGRLDFVHADGRSYVRRFADRFDVIQMTGADTYAANAACGSMLSENYLYTLEAFADYLDALAPDGILAITRFGVESARVLTTMTETLRRRGVQDPGRHLAVVKQGKGVGWLTVLARNEPFDAADLAELDRTVAESVTLAPLCRLPVYDLIGFGFNAPMEIRFRPATGVDPAAIARAFVAKDLDFSPPTDDRPFFFQFRRMDRLSVDDFFRTKEFDRNHWDVTDYLVVAAQIAIVAILLIVAPLLVLRLRGLARGRTFLAAGGFFAAIGAGFMLLEIVLMQRCSLFLGHPDYSITTVLGGLLVSSGLGAWLVGLLPLRTTTVVGLAVVGIVTWIALFLAWSPDVFARFLDRDLGVRVGLLLLMIAPLGLFLGMPFPSGLAALERSTPRLSPWAIGTNSFASVVASLAAIPASMMAGFTAVLYAAAGAYVLALVFFRLWSRAERG